MRLLTFSAALLLLVTGCRTQTTDTDAAKKETVSDGCPPIGRCEFKLIEGKSMTVRTDEFGKLSYELIDNPGMDVVKFEYINPGPKDVQDGMYREEIAFEVTKGTHDFAISGKDLNRTKMLFGVFCYCKDKAGYYRVGGGSLVRSGGQYKIEIPEIVSAQKVSKVTMKL